MSAVHLLGIAGVDPHEQPAARLWARRLEWPMAVVVLWIPFQWYLEETQAIAPQIARVADWLVWLSFLFETILLSALVKKRRALPVRQLDECSYHHRWYAIFLAIRAAGGLLRSFRLVLVVMLLVRLSKSARKLLGTPSARQHAGGWLFSRCCCPG